MIYEIREYSAVPGRLSDIIDLFNETGSRIFARYGMEIVSIGRTSIGDESLNEMVYTLRFEDLADLDAKWARFLSDPEWIAAAGEKETTGPLLKRLRRRVVDPGPFTDSSRR